MWLNQSDANVVADKIARYWHHEGYHGIRVWVTQRKGIPFVQDGWEIHSNIGADGFPPREPDDAEQVAA